VGEAIDSVLGQTFADFELLVVDDGSTDDTDAVVGAIDDERLLYRRLPANRGQATARNEGWRHARGELIAFLDSDDRWVPEKLARFLEVMRGAPDGIGCVYSDMWLVRRRQYFQSPPIERGRWINPATGWYQSSQLGIQAAMIRRHALEAVGGFDEALRGYDDMELLLRLSMIADFVHIPAPLTNYVRTPGSVVFNLPARRRARQHILRRHARAIARQSPGFIVRESLGIVRARLRE
jgi:glycosyltransferase involved in cell wall biosynthesis